MKKIGYLFIILSFIIVGGCSNQKNIETNKKAQEVSSQEKSGNISKDIKQETNIDIGYQKLRKFEKIVEKKNPEIIKNYTTYKTNIQNVSKIFKADNITTTKVIKSILPYVIKYEKLKESGYKLKAEEYKNFIIENISKKFPYIKEDEIQKIFDKKNIESMKKVYVYYKKIENYILPDGTITLPEVKQAFEEFKKSVPGMDDMVALEMFQKQITIQEFMDKLECDKIEDEIQKSECEYYKNEYYNKNTK